VIAGSGVRADRFLTKRLGFAQMIRWSGPCSHGLCSQSEGTNLPKEEQTMAMRHTRMLPGFLGATNPWLITAVAIEKVIQSTNEQEKSK
jgi:hypothetical protein